MICRPKSLMLNLWSYFVLQDARVRIWLTQKANRSQTQSFSFSEVEPNMHHLYSMICPIYQLSPDLASGKSFLRCNAPIFLGINLSQSQRDSVWVYFVLHPVTGILSQQFHCYFDKYLKISHLSSDATTNVSNWHFLAVFSKFICPSCTFTDTLLWHLPGWERDSNQPKYIN